MGFESFPTQPSREELAACIDQMSDEEFLAKYPLSKVPDLIPGLADEDQDPVAMKIIERREQMGKPVIPEPVGYVAQPISETYLGRVSDEQLPDIMPDQPIKNLDGQIVSPRTNEPVQPGSPEWQELARRNQLPLNQNDRRY